MARTIDLPTDPEGVVGLPTLESPASHVASHCNQRLSPKLLITISQTDIHMLTKYNYIHLYMNHHYVCTNMEYNDETYSVTEQLQSAGTTCASRKFATRL